MLKNCKLGKRFDVVDLSGVSQDYLLAVGETAKIVFSSATSIPLNIKTEQGEYELTFIRDTPGTALGTGSLYLNPNNTTHSNAITRVFGQWFNSTGASGTLTESSFVLGSCEVIRTTARISTRTNNKSAFVDAAFKVTTTQYVRISTILWNNTNTPWDSLGTLVLDNAMSGTVYVKRTA